MKPLGPPEQHGAAESLSSEAPSAKDVQWLSDFYDELHSANGRAEESLNSWRTTGYFRERGRHNQEMPGYFFQGLEPTCQNLILTQPIECQQEIKMAAAELQEDPSLLYASSRGALREMVSWRRERKLADYCPRALTSWRIVSSASRFTPKASGIAT